MEKTENSNNSNYYFAYGSNCNVRQMEKRCPHSVIVGSGTLENHELAFDTTVEGDAYFNVLPKDDKTVGGIVFAVSDKDDMANLDEREGYPTDYGKKIEPIKMETGETIDSWVYEMTKEYRKDTEIVEPSPAYLERCGIGMLHSAPKLLKGLNKAYKAAHKTATAMADATNDNGA
jgi:gamma-glutamylcyclotransferase (GGCT)/AIG2-like uncharacterized protein YtfP